MADTTAIEWCDSTFNPWMGCTRVSPACDHCYAARSTPARTLGVAWGPGEQRRRTVASNWAQPRIWQRHAADFQSRHGRRRRVFCASLADWLDNDVPILWLVDLMELIRATPDLDWLLLTKRIGNWSSRISEAIGFLDEQTPAAYPLPLRAWLCHWLDGDEAPRNVWLGSTVVNQAEADRDVPKLLAATAAVRFLSIEPMLGPVDVSRFMWPACGWWKGPHRSYREAKAAGAECGLKRQGLVSAHARFIDWVICGGESGPKARPMHPDWARSLRDQCATVDVPFLFKQWGDKIPGELQEHPAYGNDGSAWRVDPNGGRWHDPVEGMKSRSEWAPVKFIKVGKKAAGRHLDGRTHDAWPEVKHG